MKSSVVGFPIHVLEKYRGALGNDYKLVISDNTADTIVRNINDTVKYQKEDLPQVNPQLYTWLATINDKSSDNNIVSQDINAVNNNDMQNGKKYSNNNNYGAGNTYEIMDNLGLTYDEQRAILEYKSSGSYMLNSDLRDGVALSSEQVTLKSNLNNALDKFPVYSKTVYRNIGFFGNNAKADFDNFIAEHDGKSVVKYPYFLSASKAVNAYIVEADFVVSYEIESRNAKDIERIGLTEEKEVLFKSDTTYAIDEFTVDGKNINIKMREIENDATDNRTYEVTGDRRNAANGSANAENQRTNAEVYSTNDSVRGRSTTNAEIYSEQSAGDGQGSGNGSFENSGRNEVKDRNAAVSEGVADRIKSENNTAYAVVNKDISDDDGASRWTAKRTEGSKDSEVNIAEIVKGISDKFGIPIATGKVTAREALGIYKVKPETVRTRIANDLPTISHELGHHLDKKYGLSKSESVKALRKSVSEDFLNLYPENERNGEAVAEFIRVYLKNTNDAGRLCPDFYTDFIKTISKEDLKSLNEIASSVNEYLSYNISERYDAAIVSSQKKEKVPFKEKWHKWYSDWVDAFHPQKQVTDYVEDVTGQTLSGKNNAYILATNSLNAHTVANFLVCEGFRDLDGNLVDAKSFVDSIGMVDSKDVKLLDRYLVLRHSLEWIAPEQEAVTAKRVFADDTLENVEEIKKQIAEIEREHPEIKAAAENLYEYQNNVIKNFVIPSGCMTEEMLDTLNRKYPSYVPFYRAVGNKSGSAKGTFANQKSPIRRAKGSGELIISPTESIIRNTEKMVKLALRNQVMSVWAEYADSVDGFGRYMEKIPPDMLPHTVYITGQKGRFADALQQVLSSGDDYFAVSDLLDEIFGDSVTDFTPIANASKRIVTVLRNGKAEYYQIHDEAFYSSVAELSPQQTSGLLRIMNNVMQPMKLLITQNNPVFAATNAVRDYGTAYKLSEINNPVTFAAKYVKALGGIITNSEDYKRYKAMGGGHSSELSANIESIAKTLREVEQKDMGRARRLAYSVFRHPVETVASINDAVESTPRFMEFMRTLEKGGDLQQAIYNADDLTTNFKRSGKGSTAKAVNKTIMFNNAAIQGIDKTVRTLADKDRRKSLAHILKYVSVAVMGGLIRHFWNTEIDEEGYGNLSSYKKNNFYNYAIGDGKFISLPKERENAVLDSAVERILEHMTGNENAFYDFGGYISSQLLPPMIPDSLNPVEAFHSVGGSTIFGGLIDVGFNKDFKGSPIEGEYEKYSPSNERYSENTSKLAYALGQTKLARDFDMSPKKIDHIISSYTGILGQANKALFPMNDSRRDVTIGLRNKFISDSNYSTDVLNRMYENVEKAEKAFNYSGSVSDAVEYEKNGIITSYISGMNKAVKALPEDEQRNGRAYLLRNLNNWNYENTASQTDMLSSLSGLTVSKDIIFSELPGSSLEWTVDKQKYAYQMTPQEYHQYIGDYMTVIENARRQYGCNSAESCEKAKKAAKDYMSKYKKSVLKRQYLNKATQKGE